MCPAVAALLENLFANWPIAASRAAEGLFACVSLASLLLFGACVLRLWYLALAASRCRRDLPVLVPGVRVDAGCPNAVQRQTAGRTRFAILIPAHDEELVLGACLASLAELDYPADAYTVHVIADNCTDRTAEIGRAHGATVLVRQDSERCGKGFALAWAVQRLGDPAESACLVDAIVVLDADTVAAPNLLAAFDAGLARGERVLQARYHVLNTMESWRTRLMACGLALAHVVKPLGRERLGLSDGLKGNGMCFAREVVERVPWSGDSVTEDIEYTLRLCRAGYRVAFVPNTAVWAQMPACAAQSASQRRRWEGGRYRLLASAAPALLLEGVRKRDRILRDRAFDLFAPPFAEMFAIPCGLAGLCSVCGSAFGWHWASYTAGGWALVLGLEACYLAFGLWIARTPASVALSVLGAPVYILWKFALYGGMAVRRSAEGWKRTERSPITEA